MHICTVKSALLTEGLQKVIKVRKRNGLKPALESVHCKLLKGWIGATCTNLTDTIYTGIKCDTHEAGKQFLIPMKAQDILMQLKNVDIEIHLTGKELSFNYNDNSIKFFAEDPDDFPATQEIDTAAWKFTIEDYTGFRQLLDMHAKVASNDEMQPVITGVRFTNKLLLSSDTHRLIKTKFDIGYEPEFDILISKSFINALSSLSSAITIITNGSKITAADKNTRIISRTIEGEYPDFSQSIPKQNNLQICLDRIELMGNIKLAMQMTEKMYKRLHFTFTEEGYELSAGENDEQIKLKGGCSFKANKENVESFAVTYNGKYLQELLDILTTENVVLGMTDPKKATAMQSGNSLLIIMPIKF